MLRLRALPAFLPILLGLPWSMRLARADKGVGVAAGDVAVHSGPRFSACGTIGLPIGGQ